MIDKVINIDLIPPITEHCTSCDYESSRSFLGVLAKCPKCGGSISRGQRNTLKPVYVLATFGSYNLIDPDAKQWNYTFFHLPEGFKKSFTVDEELDFSDPLDLAHSLRDIYSSYLYTSNKDEIEKLVHWLDENEEEQDELRSEKEIQELKNRLYEKLYLRGER
jgi:hypothetical protein